MNLIAGVLSVQPVNARLGMRLYAQAILPIDMCVHPMPALFHERTFDPILTLVISIRRTANTKLDHIKKFRNPLTGKKATGRIRISRLYEQLPSSSPDCYIRPQNSLAVVMREICATHQLQSLFCIKSKVNIRHKYFDCFVEIIDKAVCVKILYSGNIFVLVRACQIRDPHARTVCDRLAG